MRNYRIFVWIVPFVLLVIITGCQSPAAETDSAPPATSGPVATVETPQPTTTTAPDPTETAVPATATSEPIAEITAVNDAGLWKLPDGDAYYAYLLRSQTSTDLTPDEIHEIGLAEVERIHDLGRLQFELLRAVRLVTDTGIHAKGWTRREAQQYMDEAMGKPGWFSHEVDRYIVMPAQATGYKIGMNKILELRQQVMAQQGDDFDIKAFHNAVLGNGSLPLEVLEQVVDNTFFD